MRGTRAPEKHNNDVITPRGDCIGQARNGHLLHCTLPRYCYMFIFSYSLFSIVDVQFCTVRYCLLLLADQFIIFNYCIPFV